jgi:Protein of unknown function (DUF3379)
VTCDDVRFALEAEPGREDPALAAHLHACPACAAYRQELLDFDRRLRAAMTVAVPAHDFASLARATSDAPGGQSTVVKWPATPGARRPAAFVRSLALAASVAGVAILAGLLWAGFPRQSLASDVVAHMAHEPQAWSTTRVLPADDVEAALGRRDVRLREPSLAVTYVQTCWFRGRRVPHLVVQTESGPVTLLVLTSEAVEAREPFADHGYRGVLVPAPRGSLAVLARDGGNVDEVVRRALESLQY